MVQTMVMAKLPKTIDLGEKAVSVCSDSCSRNCFGMGIILKDFLGTKIQGREGNSLDHTKVKEEKVVNECKKESEDKDTSKRALVDRPVWSDVMKSLEVLAIVKLEPNSVNLPDMSAKETDSC
ncbi:hypothetical protein Tco_0246232 [Tanacetum coccineum]